MIVNVVCCRAYNIKTVTKYKLLITYYIPDMLYAYSVCLRFIEKIESEDELLDFKNKRYISKGIDSRVPPLTQLFLWHCIDTLDIAKDYLQVFNCSMYDSMQKITHIQEQPEYNKYPPV